MNWGYKQLQTFKYTLALWLLVFIPIPLAAQTTITREVVGSGGGLMTGTTFQIHGTVSQSSIGRMQQVSTGIHNIGFWYKVIDDRIVANIRIPYTEGNVGDAITIPLILENAQGFLGTEPKQFQVQIRFNGTLLDPTGTTPGCMWDDGECVLTLSGAATDTTSILADMTFIAKLGNSESTTLEIADFQWVTAPTAKVSKEDGEFQLLDVCSVGGSTRLIISSEAASIISIQPNPASDKTTIYFNTMELGNSRLYIVNAIGEEIAELYNQELEQGLHAVQVDVSSIPSGKYFLILQTPTQMITRQFEIVQ